MRLLPNFSHAKTNLFEISVNRSFCRDDLGGSKALAYLETTLPTKEPGGLETYFDGLRKAGLPD